MYLIVDADPAAVQDAAGGMMEELEKISALAELLIKNAGGLTEESAQAVGDMITMSLNGITGSLPAFFNFDEEVPALALVESESESQA